MSFNICIRIHDSTGRWGIRNIQAQITDIISESNNNQVGIKFYGKRAYLEPDIHQAWWSSQQTTWTI